MLIEFSIKNEIFILTILPNWLQQVCRNINICNWSSIQHQIWTLFWFLYSLRFFYVDYHCLHVSTFSLPFLFLCFSFTFPLLLYWFYARTVFSKKWQTLTALLQVTYHKGHPQTSFFSSYLSWECLLNFTIQVTNCHSTIYICWLVHHLPSDLSCYLWHVLYTDPFLGFVPSVDLLSQCQYHTAYLP